jgi:hypothetical protein
MGGTVFSAELAGSRHFSGNDRGLTNKWDNGGLFTNAVSSWQFNGIPVT